MLPPPGFRFESFKTDRRTVLIGTETHTHSFTRNTHSKRHPCRWVGSGRCVPNEFCLCLCISDGYYLRGGSPGFAVEARSHAWRRRAGWRLRAGRRLRARGWQARPMSGTTDVRKMGGERVLASAHRRSAPERVQQVQRAQPRRRLPRRTLAALEVGHILLSHIRWHLAIIAIISLLKRTKAPPNRPFFTPSTPVGADPPVDTPGTRDVTEVGRSEP